jgi:predicted O-methyltransferase YrrM
VSPTSGDLLAGIVSEVNPRCSLEVGLGYGFSALTICTSGQTAKNERHHIIIDPHQTTYWNGIGMRHIKEAGYEEMVQLYEELSYRVLPRLESEGLKIDLAFIDGWHTFDFVFVDFFFIDKLLKEGGVVLFDDADWPSIRPVLRYVVTNLPYRVIGTLPEKHDQDPLDASLGLSGSCIALQKCAPVREREIFYHQKFY